MEEEISIDEEMKENVKDENKVEPKVPPQEVDIKELESLRKKNSEDIMTINERITSLEEEYRSIKIFTTEQSKIQERVSMELESLKRENKGHVASQSHREKI